MAMVHCRGCGKEIHETAPTCPHCGAPQFVAPPVADANLKNQTVAALWCFFLGGIGAHRFYLGRIVTGVLFLLFFWTGIPAFVSFIDLLVIVFTGPQAWADKYNGGRLMAPVGVAVKILAVVIPGVFVLGFLAAIVLPAYHDYVLRGRRASQSVELQQPTKTVPVAGLASSRRPPVGCA